MGDIIFRPTLDEEDVRLPETEEMSCIKPVDAEDTRFSETANAIGAITEPEVSCT